MRKLLTIILTVLLYGVTTEVLAKPYLSIAHLCNNPNFTCIDIKKHDTWDSLFPDEDVRDMVMRLNRMNTPLYRGMTIAIPKNLSVSVMDIAPFERQIPAPGRKVIIYDPAVYAWGAYNELGQLVKWGPASSGRSWCPDINSRCRTPTGIYSMYRKGGEDCKSTKFPVGIGGAPTAYCMFFKGGYAMHASPTVPGYHDSHGCIRLFYEDSRWLNRSFIDLPNRENGNQGTVVIVRPYPAERI